MNSSPNASRSSLRPTLRLAKLTLSGFKSFADSTDFTFDQDITGIVGPNGCGKSNVVDAIKWVLGERSSKSLRGTEMIDVIFAGSAGRKPMGMASVTLTFENPVIDATAKMVEIEVGEESEIGSSEAAKQRDSETGKGETRKGEIGKGDIGKCEAAIGETASDETGGGLADSSPLSRSLAVSLPRSSSLSSHSHRRRGLPIDADIVEVERRLFRDGTSKYLINGRIARLRDIRDLFLDTGIGADAYSIIEQGKVDAMLLASPQERRTIFEEAAGIAKYKQRRVEAQRKLERAMTNLVQSRDQLDSTERRLKLVRGQAAKARRFRELDTELAAWRLSLTFEQYDELRRKLDMLNEQQNALQSVRDEAVAALAAAEEAKQTVELERHEKQVEHKRLDQDRLTAEHTRAQSSQRRQMAERAVEEAKRQSEVDRQRLTQVTERLTHTESALTAQADNVAALAESLTDADRELKKIAEQRAAVLEELTERQTVVNERRARLNQIDRERSSLVASIQGDERRAEAIREQADRVSARIAAFEQDLSTAKAAAATHEANVESGQSRIRELEAQVAQHEGTLKQLAEGRRERAAKASELQQELVRLESRRATLTEMVQSRAGYADTVRAIMDAKDRNTGFTGVIAPLAELIQTEESVSRGVPSRTPETSSTDSKSQAQHLAAVEAALGANLQALVTHSLAGLPTQSELSALKGRATFMPVDGIVGELAGELSDETSTTAAASPGTDLESLLSGRLTCLRRVIRPRVKTDAGGEPNTDLERRLGLMLDRLLGSAYLVENLDVAMLLLAGPMRNVAGTTRFVTPDGTVLEPDGRVTAGPTTGAGQSGGILQRQRELTELDVRITALSAQVAAGREELELVDAEASELNARSGELRTKLAGEQRQLVGEQSRHERAQADINRVQRDSGQACNELAQHRQRLEKLDVDRAVLRERAESLSRLFVELSTESKSVEEEIRRVHLRAEAASEQMTAAKVGAGRLAEQLGSARREANRLEIARDDLQRQSRDVTQQLEHVGSRLAEHQKTIDDSTNASEESAALAAALNAQVAAALEALKAIDLYVRECSERVNAARSEAQRYEREWHGLEVSRRENEVKRETLEQKAHEESSLDLAFEYIDYRRMMAGGEVTRIDSVQAATEIESLREHIKKLGHVNLDSIEEETHLQAQNELLVKQVADLDSARAQLEELITKLNEVSRERFGEVFEKIRENFGGQDGMFRKLFGGGKAEVRLMSLLKEVENADGSVSKVETGETDLLESGIEVIAKPPGKEPRSISQLSGGEKTLTAVALLMSIFRSKPSCFCILDEVDAALDESNVARFGSVIRQFTDLSHFIVITHNKRTMQIADQLYGVTMQERGVSKRVKVKFEQVGKDGQISTTSGTTSGTTNGEPSNRPSNPNGHKNGHVLSDRGVIDSPEHPAPEHGEEVSVVVKPLKKDGPLRRTLAAAAREAQTPAGNGH